MSINKSIVGIPGNYFLKEANSKSVNELPPQTLLHPPPQCFFLWRFNILYFNVKFHAYYIVPMILLFQC